MGPPMTLTIIFRGLVRSLEDDGIRVGVSGSQDHASRGGPGDAMGWVGGRH